MKQLNRAMRVFLVTAILVNLANCKPKAQASEPEISMVEFIAKYDSNKQIQVMDVRTPEEYSSGHVPQAVSVPLNDLTSGSAAMPFEKNSEIYVICRSGKRSMTATEYLKSQGYSNVKSISGGTMAWSAQNKPLDK